MQDINSLSSSKIVFPNKLNPNGKIGLTAMSGGIENERDFNRITNGIKNLTNKGFEIVKTADVDVCQKLVSALPEVRAKEFLSLWKQEDINYIVIAFGGDFLMETLPYLDKEFIISSTPKWIQGFSDVSLLDFYITTNFNISTIHSVNFSQYGMRVWDESIGVPLRFVQNVNEFVQESFSLYEKEFVTGEGTDLEPYSLTEEVIYKNLYLFSDEEVIFSGRLIGGCLDALKMLIGTPFDNTKSFCKSFEEGILWYIENCEMPITELKRTLWQMKMAGWFKNTNGFLIGRTRANASVHDLTYQDVLHDIFDDMNVPVIYDVDVGHVAPQWTMINGSFAEFSYKNGKGRILQKMI